MPRPTRKNRSNKRIGSHPAVLFLALLAAVTIPLMPAAKEKISFQLVARFMALLLFLAAIAASAQARSAAENRVWKKSSPITESLLSQPLQLLELHQVKAPVRWYDASGYTFAAENAEAEAAQLQPYGGPGGGHHVPAQSAFRGAAGYDPNAALAIPNAELEQLGVIHSKITAGQQALYGAFSQTGATLTWEAVEQIETQALIRGNMNPNMAQATVRQAIQALKDAGVSGPTRIPWAGQ